MIEKRMGIRPPVLAEDEASSAPFEILIGCTDRPFSRTCYARANERCLMTFELCCESQCLQLVCGDIKKIKVSSWVIAALFVAMLLLTH